jgi:hypothetical protein
VRARWCYLVGSFAVRASPPRRGRLTLTHCCRGAPDARDRRDADPLPRHRRRRARRARARSLGLVAVVVSCLGAIGGAPTRVPRRPAATWTAHRGREVGGLASLLARGGRPRARRCGRPLARRADRCRAGSRTIATHSPARSRCGRRNPVRAGPLHPQHRAGRNALRCAEAVSHGRPRCNSDRAV